MNVDFAGHESPGLKSANSKFEMRNPKQIRSTKKKISNAHILFISDCPVSSFSFVSNFGFRISNLLFQRLPNRHRAIPVEIIRQHTNMSRKRPGKAQHIAASMPRETTRCGEGGAVEEVERRTLRRRVERSSDRRVKRRCVKRVQRTADDDHISAPTKRLAGLATKSASMIVARRCFLSRRSSRVQQSPRCRYSLPA